MGYLESPLVNNYVLFYALVAGILHIV